ncbi:acyltransferase family protein [Dermabacteraceae bacterium P13088]
MKGSDKVLMGSNGRYEWMDALRGFAILLVIIFHAPIPHGFSVDGAAFIDKFNSFFLPFRMPVLMLLSGILLPKSLNKPVTRYLSGKASGILWPLFLWLSFWIVVVSPVVGTADIGELFNPVSWVSKYYLWYLGQLFLLYVTALLFKKTPSWLPCVLFFVLFNYFVDAPWVYHESFEKTYLFFGVFFFAGYAIGCNLNYFMQIVNSNWALILLLPALAIGSSASSGGVIASHSILAWQITLILGVLGVLTIFVHASRKNKFNWLRWIGKNSIVFYVVHFPVEHMIFWAGYKARVAYVLPEFSYLLILSGGLLVPGLLVFMRSNPAVAALFVAPEKLKLKVGTARK